MECYLFDGRVTAGEPWNVICLMGAMECYLFDGSCGMLFVWWEGDCWGEPWNVICLMGAM